MQTIEASAELAARAAVAAGMSRLADLTGLDSVGIPAFSSVRPGAEPGNQTITGGKGITPLAARVSAMMEAVERHCGERRGRVGTFATWTQASESVPTLDPRRLILSDNHTWTADSVMEWWPARELFTGCTALVPAAAVLNPYRLSPWLFVPSSNGLAAGNTLPEALAHALLEVIERDAVSFGETLGDGRELLLNTVDDRECAELIGRFRAAGLDLRVRVMSYDVQLPTFHALLDDPVSRDPMLINGGFGCHPSPRVGLARALTEAALSRATVVAGAREDLDREQVKRQIGYDALKKAFESWFAPPVLGLAFGELAECATDNIHDDLSGILNALRQAGFQEAYAVDLTLPDIGVAVVRTIVPGLELYHVDRGRMGPRLRQRLGKNRP